MRAPGRSLPHNSVRGASVAYIFRLYPRIYFVETSFLIQITAVEICSCDTIFVEWGPQEGSRSSRGPFIPEGTNEPGMATGPEDQVAENGVCRTLPLMFLVLLPPAGGWRPCEGTVRVPRVSYAALAHRRRSLDYTQRAPAWMWGGRRSSALRATEVDGELQAPGLCHLLPKGSLETWGL